MREEMWIALCICTCFKCLLQHGLVSVIVLISAWVGVCLCSSQHGLVSACVHLAQVSVCDCAHLGMGWCLFVLISAWVGICLCSSWHGLVSVTVLNSAQVGVCLYSSRHGLVSVCAHINTGSVILVCVCVCCSLCKVPSQPGLHLCCVARSSVAYMLSYCAQTRARVCECSWFSLCVGLISTACVVCCLCEHLTSVTSDIQPGLGNAFLAVSECSSGRYVIMCFST